MTLLDRRLQVVLACALVSGLPVFAQQPAAQDPAPQAAVSSAPKILILSNRSSSRVEVAGAPQQQATPAPAQQQPQAGRGRAAPVPQPEPAAVAPRPRAQAQAEPPGGIDPMPVPPGRRQSARAQRDAQQVAASDGSDAQASGPPSLEERRRRLAQRSQSSRASQSPAAAGIPVGKGDQLRGAQPRSAIASRAPRQGGAAQAAAAAPAAAAVAAPPGPPPVIPPPPTAPQLAKGPVDTSNPLANELVRNGDSYVFRGSLNGKPVQFRLSENAHGLVVPANIAVMYGIVPPAVVDGKSSVDIYTPVQTMSVGAHPVSAVMARVTSIRSHYVEVGVDALQAFKVVNENGRRLLLPAQVE